MSSIVFISDLTVNDEKIWISKINESLLQDEVKLPHQLNDEEVLNVDIAIVANPNPDDLAKYPNLVWIQSLWAGVEKLLNNKLPPNVHLVRLIDPSLSKTMAESVVAWTLYLQRQIPHYEKQQQSRCWKQLPNIASSDLRVSILGAGELGLASLNLLNHFDYQLSCWTRSPKEITNVKNYTGNNGLSEMLTQTDILISLLPLTPGTHHILNHDSLSQLPKGAQVINFSRGAIIDTQSLIKLLDKDHLSHAILDVFDVEPLPVDSPLWDHEKISVLPHISAPTNADTAISIAVANIQQYRTHNELPTTVDLKKGY